MNRLLSPLIRSVAQITDPAFLGVLALSLVCSAAVFALLHLGVLWVVHRAFALRGWLAWGADVLGSVGAWLLGQWLFLPLAAGVATLFIDRVARAVERQWYPMLPPARGASLVAQIVDGLALMWRILLLSLLALVLALVLPGVGLLLAWVIGAYAIGRGLFMAVALRRFDRRVAERLYFANRSAVLMQGGIMALAGYLPGFNLLIPVLGTAAMVHVLDDALRRGAGLGGVGSAWSADVRGPPRWEVTGAGLFLSPRAC
jgi:CysZ protein